METIKRNTPLLILVGFAVVVFGIFLVVYLTDQDGNGAAAEVTEEGTATLEVTPEGADDTEATGEDVDESTGDAEGDTNEQGETTATPTPETEDEQEASEQESAESTEDESEAAGPTPTSLSRNARSILIGTQVTPMLQTTPVPVTETPSDEEENGSNGTSGPTPTSLSRVRRSILIGVQITPNLQSTPAQEGEATATPTPTSANGTPSSDAGMTPTLTPEDEELAEPTEEADSGEGGVIASRSRPAPPSDGSPSVLHPQGPVAERQATLWWLMFVIGAVVYLGVIGLVLMLIYKHRQGNLTPLSERNSRVLIWGGGVVMPLIILSVLFGLTLHTMVTLANANNDTQLTIEVTGYQWWWEVRYPEGDLVTANEIHIPAGEPVRFSLFSNDVIHSFWVPELGGKLDMFPGRTTTFWLQADEPGVYRGQCAEFCGIQHARMAFFVVAHEREAFDTWLSDQQQDAREPQSELVTRGQEVFLNSECIACHTVRGTNAAGIQGPDLTHFGSRMSIAAGTLANTTENLADWIAHPQEIKPGNLMPDQDIEGEHLEALVAYLESLQ